MLSDSRVRRIALSILLATGCSDRSAEESARPDVPEGAVATYGELCGGCHGGRGEGGSGPRLAGWGRGRAELVERIASTMPPSDPDQCTGACAAHTADAVLAFAVPDPSVACPEPIDPPRQLRLLTRQEWVASLESILDTAAGDPCSATTDCSDPLSLTCSEGRCRSRPCNLAAFAFTPERAPREVVVAGSFNGWGATAAEGGWPLRRVAGRDLWFLERELPEGRHSYKLVIDGTTWLTDPNRRETEDDGFGGRNSVIEVSCGGGAGRGVDLQGLAEGIPVESRPEGFPFSGSASAGWVGTSHLEAYTDGARAVAAHLVSQAVSRFECDYRNADCSRRITREVAEDAFRRPLAAEEVSRFEQLATRQGLEAALRVVLASPRFLYRSELGVPEGDRFVLSGYETASALAYTLTGGPPDAVLLEDARAGRLARPDGREAAARRLLDDPRAREQVRAFGRQWLGITALETIEKHPASGGEFSLPVRRAALAETDALLEYAFFDPEGEMSDLLTADFTFVQPELAGFLGWPAEPAGRRELPPAEGRSGVLGQVSLLASLAHSDQSSPILRGVFVRERLLCQTFGAPPADAGGVPDVDPDATTRERFRQHADNPRCQSCHKYIDELGFGFEPFDSVGRYRREENGQAVDPSGLLRDVEGFGSGSERSFSRLSELGALLAESEAARSCFGRQLWRFTYGTLDAEAAACALKRAGLAQGARVRPSELWIALIKDPGFVRRRQEASE